MFKYNFYVKTIITPIYINKIFLCLKSLIKSNNLTLWCFLSFSVSSFAFNPAKFASICFDSSIYVLEFSHMNLGQIWIKPYQTR